MYHRESAARGRVSTCRGDRVRYTDLMTRRDIRRPSVDEARPRVLFVDDERHVQRAFEQAAFSLGVVVELANSATQALRAVEQGRFDGDTLNIDVTVSPKPMLTAR